jgi:RNA methyltransferase, TrmH family
MTQTIETISSASNDLIKRLKGLERKKERVESGLFLAEGARLCEQGLAQGWTCDVLALAANVQDRPHIAALAQRARASGARVVAIADRLMEKITHKDNAQSVIGAFRQKALRLEDLPASTGVPLYVGLWEVRDPGNLGTILRTADCAAASGVVMIGTCCDPYSFEAVRASMGSIFDVPLARAAPDAFASWRAARGLNIACASVNGEVRHDQTDMRRPTLVLMGNEQAGLPRDVEDACDTLVRLPMRGGADSLNLAQASAIMIYEAWRQRDFK